MITATASGRNRLHGTNKYFQAAFLADHSEVENNRNVALLIRRIHVMQMGIHSRWRWAEPARFV